VTINNASSGTKGGECPVARGEEGPARLKGKNLLAYIEWRERENKGPTRSIENEAKFPGEANSEKGFANSGSLQLGGERAQRRTVSKRNGLTGRSLWA